MRKTAKQTQKRREDARFITGAGRYAGDIDTDGTVHLVFVRSPHAHARILNIDTKAARASKGVVAVFTGAELSSAGIKPIAGGFPVGRPDGEPAPSTPQPGLVENRVRHLGAAVAAVAAHTRAQALAAAESVVVDYEPAPCVTAFEALEPGAPIVWDEAPDNIAFRWRGGDEAATSLALDQAAHVTRLTLRVTRVCAQPMETRVVAAWPGEDGRLVVTASNQSPHALRDGLAASGFDKSRLTVRVGDVGGSFGLKWGIAPEDIVVAFAARKLKRRVLWECTRSEAFLADNHGRGFEADCEIGFDKKKRIVGLRVRGRANLGAYVSVKSIWVTANIGGIAGVYLIPTIAVEVDGVLTHTSQTSPYRGAGRPEATYIIERLLDAAARELGVSPFELRRRNLIPALAMPYQTALTFRYDCGDFAANMDMVKTSANLRGFATRRRDSARRGRLRGLGVANCIEVAGGPLNSLPPDIAEVALLQDGRLRVTTGTQSVGQGHETTFPQLVAERFGVPLDQVDYCHGNTDSLPFGRGNGGSCALCVGGSAVTGAASGLVDELTSLAAERLEVQADSLTLTGGIFRSRDGNKTLSLADLASTLQPDSEGASARRQSTFKPHDVNYPNGTHVCEVEIDPDTGMVEVVAYSAVEDIGRVLHPVLAEGQIQGGVAQGIGQALGENIVYDESGQLLTGSFMDYRMPRANDLPSFWLGFNEVPTTVNPLGAKGVGEAGTVGALAATMNAISDALAQRGVADFEMPASPDRIWRALNAANWKKLPPSESRD